MSTYHVENFGCRATQADGAALERQFAGRGLSRAINVALADLVVINSCTVTAAADQDARSAIRRVRRQNPDARIIVTGCYAQRAPEEVAALPGVACVIGNSHKHQLADLALAGPADSGSSSASCAAAIESDRGWSSASSAAAELTKSAPALAAEGKAFVPLASLTTEAPHRKPEAVSRKPEAESRKPIPKARLYVSNIFAHTELLAAPVFEVANKEFAAGDGLENQRTRPNLKVQDGCDNRCSFCVIPFVRGQSRSLPPKQILREVNALVAAGYREVVISGINLGRWGRDLDLRPPTSDLDPSRNCNDQSLTSEVRRPRSDAVRKPEARSPKPALESLIRAILSETRLEKLRISSVEPMDWSRDLIALMASSPRIAKHAHVPLQSGSDAVLRRMHRKYRPWHYRERIEQIRAALPSAAIGADVMAGFPGETDAEFEATRRLIEDLPFTYLHVFTYSARPGTPAALMPDQVPVHVARERNRILRDLAAGKKLAFMESFIGKSLNAITLSVVHNGHDGDFTEALTDNYQRLYLKGRHAPNCWITAHIEGVEDGAFVGSQAIPADSTLEVVA